MTVFIKMGWRNIFRHGFRSFLTISAIGIGLAALIVLRSLNEGFHEQMVENVIDAGLGHIQILPEGYEEEPSVDKYIKDPKAVFDVIDSISEIAAYAPEINFQGMIDNARNSRVLVGVGVDFDKQSDVSMVHRNIIEGELPGNTPEDENYIVIGERMARSLEAKVGDKVVLMTYALDMTIASGLYRIKGIFRIGSPEHDKFYAYMPIESAQKLLAYGEYDVDDETSAINGGIVKLTRVIIKLKDSSMIPDVQEQLKDALADNGIVVMSWMEITPFILQIVKLDDIFLFIILIIFFVVVAIGVLNTMLMAVNERIGEFGVMRAMGTKPRQIVLLIFIESLFLGLMGLVAGNIIGCAISAYYGHYGIDFSRYTEAFTAFIAMDTIIFTKATPYILWTSSLAVMITCMVAAVYPSIKAAKLQPIEAIRHL